ncbi:MAG TPA: 30S ribosomal protein S9 [Candidatus Paceibacterota bacterium]|jgi:small subunit ribosomal protein S9|nr:30S ribosomal protein S9 [Candidatus Paceibacterota bacterium]HOH11345.1 30S ribosomal protein S9 [Candidatus Paceibacterota bacterium]HOY10927.1 30S ribosomal protein S9 [Candidatus Paceibacterota bacterium]HPI24639.1 30S ribosomal protein S9 [Candidatus Paceibacterota bacterium]HPN89296.1 30S ribosomal protein S9 [Candidatus Paceibacterota bacterium]
MATVTKDKYIEAVGRRKTSIARVRLYTGKGEIVINDRPFNEYFPTEELRIRAKNQLADIKNLDKFLISVKMSGGGISSQAEAFRLGLARAIVKADEKTKAEVKKAGLLTRDGRKKERYKFGLKKARKSPQWSKR